MNQYKLSAFMPVCKAMLDLGPVWLDRYVRTVLVESLKIALEVAIVRGTGKDQPIGMMKDLLNVTNGEHADKAVTATLKDLSPYTLGNIMALLTRDGKRNPEDVMLIVNPVDYWAKVYGYTHVLMQMERMLTMFFQFQVHSLNLTLFQKEKWL